MAGGKYTVTAALPYANGPLHLGHVAGVYLPADIFTRFLRLNGDDVVFICGSDEHGAAITLRAKKEGVTPKEIVDKYHSIISSSFKNFDISIVDNDNESVNIDKNKKIFRNKLIVYIVDNIYDVLKYALEEHNLVFKRMF